MEKEIIQDYVHIDKKISLNKLREKLIHKWLINENWEGICIDNISRFILYKYDDESINKILFRGYRHEFTELKTSIIHLTNYS